MTCTLTADQIRQTYLACYAHPTNALLDSLADWPVLFKQKCTTRPELGELEHALASFRAEAHAGPSFMDVKDRILRQRMAANVANRERHEPSRDCQACNGDGYIQVFTTPKPGHGTRIMRPDQPECLPGREVYVAILPCVCAEGDRVNAEQMTGAKGGDVPPQKAYGYSRQLRERVNRCRIATREIPVYRYACETMYREAKQLPPPDPLPELTDDGPLREMVDRIMERAKAVQERQ
jgi:hypothetical protein